MSTANPLDELRRRLGNGPAPGAFAALAEEHRRAGRLDEAVGVCREGLARYPSYVSARVTLGRALLDMGDVPAAITELEQAVGQAPDNLAAVKALDAARSALDLQTPDSVQAGFDGSHADVSLAPAGAADGDGGGLAARAPESSSLAWLTPDPVETPWEVEPEPEPEFESEPEPQVEPEPQSAPDAAVESAAWAPVTEAWDETIYAPVTPIPAEGAETLPVEPPSPVDVAATEAADEAVAWASDDVMTFPAFVDDDATTPEAIEADASPATLSAQDVDDPLAAWTGFAEAPARSDANGWGAWVDASLDEVFADGADAAPPSQGSALVEPEPVEPDDVGLESAAVDRAATVAGDGLADAVSPLQTLETLLLTIRARREALARRGADAGLPDVD